MPVGIQLEPKPCCPDCGAKMRLRRRHADGKPFWGCELWPECEGSLDIGPDGKPVLDDERQEFTPFDF